MATVSLKSYDFPTGYQSAECATHAGPSPTEGRLQSCKDNVVSVFVVDRRTIFCKLYYFTACAAFGSIRPFLSIFLKQRGLSPLEIGVVSGVRTFAGSVSGITLSVISDRFHIRRILFIITLLGYLATGSLICFLPNPPRATVCPDLLITDSLSRPNAKSVSNWTSTPLASTATSTAAGNSKLNASATVSSEPTTLSTLSGPGERKTNHYPKESLWWLYEPSSHEIQFFIVLVTLALGEAFLVPYQTFGDIGILHVLEERASTGYGAQRSWGPLGFGITALLAGLLLTSSRTQVTFCGESIILTDYTLMAAFFIPLHIAAIFCGLQFRFKEGQRSESKGVEVTQYTCHQPSSTSNGERMQVTLQSELMVDVQENTSSIMEHSDVIDLVQRKQQRGGVTSASAEDVMTPSERFNVLRLLLTVQHGSWLLIVFYIGMCNGLIWSFAFWHLENIGATQFMLGLGSVIGHVIEFGMCFFIARLIDVLGHGGVLCLSLCGYVLRFALYASATSPWIVIPTEGLQGLALSSVWVCVTSYVTKTVSPANIATLQGIMAATFWGLGVGTGDFIAGPLVQYYGAVTTFYGLSVTTAAVAVAFFILLRVRACLNAHHSD